MTLVMNDVFADERIDAGETHELVESSPAKIATGCFATKAAERRRGLRIRQARPIRVYEPSCARYFGGQTEDISATGLRIELPASAEVHPGKVVSIHVGLNREGSTLPNRKHMMTARVVWVDRTFSRGFAVVGVEFMVNIAAHLDAA